MGADATVVPKSCWGEGRVMTEDVLLGAGNAAGGYVVTERMLDMFKSSKKEGAK